MLTTEQAQKQLATWKIPEEENRIAAGVKKLPAALRKLAETIWDLDSEEARKLDWPARQERQRKAMSQLAKLSAKERTQLFGLLSPHLTASLEAGWQLLTTVPYQVGYSRRAFRTPTRPQQAINAQFEWLKSLAGLVAEYQAEIVTPAWLATWAVHLGRGEGREIGILLAAVLNKGGKSAGEVHEVLRQSLSNQHEIGAFGRHIITAFLLSEKEEHWSLVEKTLLAAQRQEGLRQVILESIDEAHPGAFRRMLRLILDQDLIRFSATVRAVDVWFGHLWSAASAGIIKKMLTELVEFLEQPASRTKAINGKDPQSAFLALWCIATEDALASIPLAEKLLSSKTVEMRYIAAKHLSNLYLDVSSAAVQKAIDDADLRVAILGLHLVNSEDDEEMEVVADDVRFEKIEKLLERVPVKPTKLDPLVWPWTEIQINQQSVAGCLVDALGKRPATRLLPHLSKLHPYQRMGALSKIIDQKPWSAETRQTILDLAGDAASDTRSAALNGLKKVKLTTKEVEQLESYLTRKAGDLRRAIFGLILDQDDKGALASGQRLVASKDANQRLAGLELLRLMTDAKRLIPECRKLATEYAAARKKVNKEEQAHLDEIAKDKASVASLENALGLMNPADRTPVVPPQKKKVPFITPAAVACIKSLDELIHKHRDTAIKIKTYRNTVEDLLLANAGWQFPSPDWSKPVDKQKAKLPLAEIWEAWFQGRKKDQRDSDGLELTRALLWAEFDDSWDTEEWTDWGKNKKRPERKDVLKTLSGGQDFVKMRYNRVLKEVLEWLLFLHPVDANDYFLDAIESAYAMVPKADLEFLAKSTDEESDDDDDDDSNWRGVKPFSLWHEGLSNSTRKHKLTPAQRIREWKLLHWLDEPIPGAKRSRPGESELLAAYSAKVASLADIADQMLGPRSKERYSGQRFDLLSSFSQRKRSDEVEAFLKQHPEVKQLFDAAVERILELELARGDAPTAATAPANALEALWGTKTLLRVLRALGKAEFKVSQSWRQTDIDRRTSLTGLAKTTYPQPEDTPEEFVKLMKAAVKAGEFPEDRLLQLTFLAPQWTKFIQAYFGWDFLDEGVYWFLAHMRGAWGATENAALAAGEDEAEMPSEDEDDEDSDEDSAEDSEGEPTAVVPKPKKLSPWERIIVERTSLSDSERDEGAIDVIWFRRVYEQLGPKHWEALATAARFAATSAQAKKAKQIGEVLLGKIPRQQLVDGIKKKQLKENVRLLGLLPLAAGKKRETDLRERCQILREYRRYANTLSGLTKPDAIRSWQIGMKNLAQTSGYPDPLRLEWAVGAEAVADLAKGPVSVKKGDVTVTLSLDEFAKPSVAVQRGDKPLKSVPPAIKKDKKIAELTARVADIRRQASGIKQSLEAAMCRGDSFTGDELKTWCSHALLWPLISRLVVQGEGILGYPDKGGKALRDCKGKFEPVKPAEVLRFAHSHDLYATGHWQDWQRDCFTAERIQPFKQIFRELYLITKQEKKDGTVSHRYAGQQVQPKQAMALFGSRGWNTGEGIFKVFHDEGLIVDVSFDYGVTTPAEVEGWTLADVSFRKREEWKPLKLTAVPPRVFSEVMRDLDLVVSVAHAGGVDPEASASTVEMREALIRETMQLLKVKNVKLKASHAVIAGKLAEYSVHLGSGNVHRLPGGSLCIVPVHAQQRGRIFIPFADDDPRTAEVVSKVLLLARDHEIQDPTILEQIRG